MAPRQGRQPRSQPANPSSRSVKPTLSSSSKSKSAATSKKAQRSAAQQGPASSLDLYSYTPRDRRARGDVDPEARANFEQRTSKSKRKRLERTEKGGELAEEDYDDSEEDEEDDDAIFHSNEIVQFTGVKPKGLKMGKESDEDEENKFSDNDEEIDSDEADESDELPPARAKPSTSKQVEINLEEEEIDSQDEEGEDYMDLTEMLDQGVYASEQEQEDGDSDSDAPEMSQDSDSDSSASSHDSEYSAALTKLNSFVEGLESHKKRKADTNLLHEGKDGKRKRTILKEKVEAYPEGEFVAVGAENSATGKVELEDLLSSFADSNNPRIAALRKTLKPLSSAASSTTPAASKSHLKTKGALAAPLPPRLLDKIDREAAYEKTKEETDKWNETVRRMKGDSGLGVQGARHERLVLPLPAASGDVTRDPNANEWSAKFEARNELENSIQTLLVAGQMSAADIRKAESSQLAALDPADLAAHQAELRQQRDLMFRAERKAKRVSKIKSKAFRRIHRRAKGKLGDAQGFGGLTLEELAEMDKLDGGDRVLEEKARLEVERARERATLKHSSKGSRWSKTNIGGLEGLDEERNSAVREMVKRQTELTKKIAGKDSDDEQTETSDDDDDESRDSDEEETAHGGTDYSKIRQRAFDELAALEEQEREFAAAQTGDAKGVLNMKFMKDAQRKREDKVNLETAQLRQRLERMDEMAAADQDGDVTGSDEELLGLSEQVEGNLGRAVFGPSRTQSSKIQAPEKIPAKKISQTTSTKLSAPLSISHNSSRPHKSPLTSETTPRTTEASNPWLTVAEENPSLGKQSRKSNKVSGKDARQAVKLSDKVAKDRSKQIESKQADQDDATVDVDLSLVLTTNKNKGKKSIPSAKNSVSLPQDSTNGDEATDSSDDEIHEQDIQAQRGVGPTAFQQRNLVAQAFAGDDVIAEFEAEKRKEIERDAPREQDDTLPGWGNWGGRGVKKNKHQKKFVTKIPGIAPEQRKDANFSNVIISEKKDKKASKYLLKDLPFPYTSAAQHEHKLRTPMGPEWSTATILRDQTLPSVLIKPGVTIRPVDRKI